jgi:aryl-alcohol dehydrogenase-like predicted oxidoreductase
VDAVGWLGELQRAGKIACVGTTNFDVERLREMAATGVPLVSHQVQYSLLDRRPQHYLQAYLQEAGGSMLCYGSLAGGFLSRKWLGVPEPDSALSNRSLTKYRLIIEEAGGWDACQELLRELDAIAVRHGVDIPHVASAWVLEQSGVGAVIVGIRSVEHLSDARRAFGVALTPGDQARIQALLARHQGPAGDTFGLERVQDGPHAAIMWTDLNRARPTAE